MNRDPLRFRIDRETIEIFDELPGKRGCSIEVLDQVERQFEGTLPPLYRRLMLSDAYRVAASLRMIHPDRLIEERKDVDRLLSDEQETYTFRLKKTHIVISHDELGFEFIEANGSDSTPVYHFDTDDDSDNVLPGTESPSLVVFLSQRIRRCFDLPAN